MPAVVLKKDKDNEVEWNIESFRSAINIFGHMQQSTLPETAAGPQDDAEVDSTPSYATLRIAINAFYEQFNQRKKAEYAAREAKRVLSGAQTSVTATVKSHVMFSTIDRPSPHAPSSYHPRYTPTVWHDAGHQQEPPPIMMQYALKPWAPPTKSPDEPASTPKKPPKKVRPKLGDDHEMRRKDILDELAWEHPTVTLDLGTLNKNVAAAFQDRPSLESKLRPRSVVSCIRGAVREALDVKRQCQELVPPTTSSKEGEEEEDNVEDGHSEGNRTAFLQSFLAFLYSRNMPLDKGSGPASRFIRRLQELDLFPMVDRDAIRTIKEYRPSFLVRSAASQLAEELKRQYNHGAKQLAEQ
ncbi:hypothetical protein BGZ80_007619, partial [Entomortierella chlamydospora]